MLPCIKSPLYEEMVVLGGIYGFTAAVEAEVHVADEVCVLLDLFEWETKALRAHFKEPVKRAQGLHRQYS